MLEQERPPHGIEVTTDSQTGPGIPPDLLPPRAIERTLYDNGSETPPPELPPPYRGSPIHTCTPIYDDATPKESPSTRDIAMPNTPSTVPDTPPNLPPPRCSEVHCDSEIPPELPPPYRGSPIPTCTPVYDDVTPKESPPTRDSTVPNAPTTVPDSPPKLPPHVIL